MKGSITSKIRTSRTKKAIHEKGALSMVTSVVLGGKTTILSGGMSARYAPSKGAPSRPRIASRKEVIRMVCLVLISFKVQANFGKFKRKPL